MSLVISHQIGYFCMPMKTWPRHGSRHSYLGWSDTGWLRLLNFLATVVQNRSQDVLDSKTPLRKVCRFRFFFFVPSEGLWEINAPGWRAWVVGNFSSRRRRWKSHHLALQELQLQLYWALRPHQHIDEAPEAKHIRPTDSLDRPGYCSKLEIHTIYEFIYWFVGH